MTKAELKKLYCDRRRSMMEIAQELQTTHATILYWLKRYQIPRRSWSESTYVKLNPHGDPFLIPTRLTEKQQTLLVAGLLLYWAEGAKANKEAVQLGNLDGRMLQVFARFLREVCRIDERRLKVYVRVHKQFSLSTAHRYWSRLLQLPSSQVRVYYHTDKRSKANRQWSRYGLAVLVFSSTKLRAWLDRAIERYITFLLSTRRNSHPPATVWCRHERLLADGVPEPAHSMLVDESGAGLGSFSWATQANQNN